MKLKTILRKSGPEGRSIVDYIEGSEVDYDAAAAHALMRALSERLGVSTNDECAGNVVTWIKLRADEIMAEWGFDSGEVE